MEPSQNAGDGGAVHITSSITAVNVRCLPSLRRSSNWFIDVRCPVVANA